VDYVPVCWGDGSAGQTTPPADLWAFELVAGQGMTCSGQHGQDWTCWGSGGVPPGAIGPYVAVSRWEPSFTCAYNAFDAPCIGTPVEPTAVPLMNHDTRPDACRSDCTLAGCGDGVVDTGESCDDGNTVAGDGCNSSCAVE
jgi:cysteine-rich repeat protein